MTALAEDLAVAQYAGRLDLIANRTEKLEAQISSAANLRSMLLNLSTSLGTRIREGDLSAQPSVGNVSVAAAALSGSQQPKGSYSLEVEQLAQQQVLSSAAYAAGSDTVGAGTITLKFGTVSGGAFTENAAKPAVDIVIQPGATLAETAKAINGANAGVQAYVANTVDGAQLVLKGADGAANGFILEVAEDGANPGLSKLAWQPGSASGTLMQEATDARFKIDGLTKTASSNVVKEALPGVNLTLSGTNIGAPTSVRFSDPSAGIKGAMQDLVSALNEIAAELNAATDPLSGDLGRDYSARSFRQDFTRLASEIIMPSVAAGGIRSLGDLGVNITRDGTFDLDSQRLDAAIERDPEGVAAMFTTGVNGIYGTIDKISREEGVASDPGSLAGAVSRFNKQLANLADDKLDLEEDQETTRQRLVAQFAVSDARVSQFNSTLSFLKSQIDAWNASSD